MLTVLGETKAIATDDRASVNHCPFADNTIGINDDIGVKSRVVADHNAVSDDTAWK